MQVLGVVSDGVAYTYLDISPDPDSFTKEALCGLLGQAAEMQLRKTMEYVEAGVALAELDPYPAFVKAVEGARQGSYQDRAKACLKAAGILDEASEVMTEVANDLMSCQIDLDKLQTALEQLIQMYVNMVFGGSDE